MGFPVNAVIIPYNCKGDHSVVGEIRKGLVAFKTNLAGKPVSRRRPVLV